MRRRDTLLGIGAMGLCLPSGLHAEKAGPRRVGALMPIAESDPDASRRVVAFLKALHEEGWREGDLKIEWRWVASRSAGPVVEELVALSPDVLVASSTALTREVLQRTRSIPTVFVLVADPVASGFAESLARPGANATGFLNFEASVASKWVQLLKEAIPDLAHVTLLFSPQAAAQGGGYFYPAFETAAAAIGITSSSAGVERQADLQPAIAAAAHQPRGGLVVAPDAFTAANRRAIIEAVNGLGLPAIYSFRQQAVEGGLIAYGIDTPEVFRLAATYVSRLLRGAQPTDLPIQAPTKLELVINLKTAKILGLTIPPTLLARADEVIE